MNCIIIAPNGDWKYMCPFNPLLTSFPFHKLSECDCLLMSSRINKSKIKTP